MSVMMFRENYQNGFASFAQLNDQRWEEMEDAEKKLWKERARAVRMKPWYKRRFLPVEKSLKKTLNLGQTERQALLSERHNVILHLIADYL